MTHRDGVLFSWEVSNPQSNPLECTLDPGDDTPPHEIDCSHNGVRHTYSQPGEYEATLTVTDDHNNTHSATTTVMVNNPPAPVINNFTNSTPVIVNETASFTWDISMHPDDHPNATCSINYGDGTTYEELCENANTTSHEFSTPGEHTVTLTVTDEYAQETSHALNITVIHPPPVITSFTGPETTNVNHDVTVTWTVDYDGHPDTLTCSITEHAGATPIDVSGDCTTGSRNLSYSTVGHANATFSVSDDHGHTVTEQHSLYVDPAIPPEINIFTSNSPVTHPYPVLFEWEVSNPQGDPLTCTFHPGDGDNLTELTDCENGTLERVYFDGKYEPVIIIYDEYGNQDSATTTIEVRAPEPSAGP